VCCATEDLSDQPTDEYDVQEFVEGVMVNGFVGESQDMNWATPRAWTSGCEDWLLRNKDIRRDDCVR
jgi:hypothetical protein